ncbi:hypothetical protein FD754_005140, partial [Muntiacus muntjak]
QSLRLTPQRYGDTFWESLSQRPTTGCSQPGQYGPEGLPPPEVLCRRKRRRPHSGGMQQGSGGIPARVRAVTHHLEDLRRRQRKAQWGSSGAASGPLLVDSDGCGFPSTTEHPDQEEERLLWSPWSPLGQEGSCLSRQLGSMGPFSTVTATRKPFYHPWGVELQSEEEGETVQAQDAGRASGAQDWELESPVFGTSFPWPSSSPRL